MKFRQQAERPSVSGRSPCGERGLKCSIPFDFFLVEGRSPCGERGLKSLRCRNVADHRGSLPVRGAWIEIILQIMLRKSVNRRSPCGERGLKSLDALKLVALRTSLPVRGAWIEIWTARNRMHRRRKRRSPCGERGLKCHADSQRRFTYAVAPRAGSVD